MKNKSICITTRKCAVNDDEDLREELASKDPDDIIEIDRIKSARGIDLALEFYPENGNADSRIDRLEHDRWEFKALIPVLDIIPDSIFRGGWSIRQYDLTVKEILAVLEGCDEHN